jgi:hypothetical protein
MKKEYSKPELAKHGKLEEQTQSGTPAGAPFDSGNS